MEISAIAKPYANALSALKTDKQGWLLLLKAATDLSENETIKLLLASPKLNKADKNKVITTLLEKAINKDLSAEQERFVQLLINYKRFFISCYITELFTKNITTSSTQINISTAYDLTKTEIDSLRTKLAKTYKENINLNIKTKPSLLAGAVISSGDKVRNHSIAAKLEKLGSILSSK